MKEAAPILGPLEFSGMENNIILVEHDEDDCSIDLLAKSLMDKVNIIFGSGGPPVTTRGITAAIMFCNSIAEIHKVIKSLEYPVDFYIINRIDMMDLGFNRREKGAQTKAYISMLCSKKTLRGANVIVTSGKSEYAIREIADRYISLRK